MGNAPVVAREGRVRIVSLVLRLLRAALVSCVFWFCLAEIG